MKFSSSKRFQENRTDKHLLLYEAQLYILLLTTTNRSSVRSTADIYLHSPYIPALYHGSWVDLKFEFAAFQFSAWTLGVRTWVIAQFIFKFMGKKKNSNFWGKLWNVQRWQHTALIARSTHRLMIYHIFATVSLC